jgi:hypothetical protein
MFEPLEVIVACRYPVPNGRVKKMHIHRVTLIHTPEQFKDTVDHN